MNKVERYTISELAEAAGATQRTIRYYTAEGLLPPPDTRGRYALYGRDHLRRLELIARLKEAYLPLNEIKARVTRLKPEEVEQALTTLQTAPTQAPQADAAEYIARVLQTQNKLPLPQIMEMQASPELQPSALINEQSMAPATHLLAPRPPQIMEDLSPTPAPVVSAPKTSLHSRFFPSPAEDPAIQAAPVGDERWQRLTLAPGVELHVREPLEPLQRARVEQLIAQARELLK